MLFTLLFITVLNFFRNEILRKGGREEGLYQWGLSRAPAVNCTLRAPPSQAEHGPSPTNPNVPVTSHPPAHSQPILPPFMPSGSSTAGQLLLDKEATEVAQRGDTTPQGHKPVRGTGGTQAGTPASQQVLQMPRPGTETSYGVNGKHLVVSGRSRWRSSVSGKQTAQRTHGSRG